ncbi:RNA polymerase subunit sigma-24 [Bordetella genomosp. 1]|uniref:RNA polymerase subunit sigma-24 n=1 Tax=Bordetella genomosp. 1 TaxID=1395607 RepID=A0A261RWA9_9BORD|nr:RNA polymerase sigma factor [Bordetella genomosp. 1]OZI29215.1 RNA polymerase subunit sigma-24 [Bordetella genomosp. 1]
MTAQDEVRHAIDAVWRIESPKVVAHAARYLRDVALAEEAAQDALVAALEHWPRDGVPANPAAWLMTAARHRALDMLRQAAAQARGGDALARETEALGAAFEPDIADAIDARRADDIGDDMLRLIFTACHPVLSADARVALTLKLLGGLSTAEIARACLQSEATVAQRIVRAKRTLSAAGVPFEVPRGEARHARLDAVLEVIYLIFNEGHAATAGDAWTRPALCDEALRLARVLAALMPQEGEVLGLAALLELQASRLPARVDAQGRPVLLLDQDRGRWDRLLIRRGLAALAQALACGPAGPYVLQAALAACHARAARAADTDWAEIVRLYDALYACLPSPVVALNRAVAVGMAQGPEAALVLVDALGQSPAMAQYPWWWSARGDLLARLGRGEEAATAFLRAAALTRNQADRTLLEARAQQARAQQARA